MVRTAAALFLAWAAAALYSVMVLLKVREFPPRHLQLGIHSEGVLRSALLAFYSQDTLLHFVVLSNRR